MQFTDEVNWDIADFAIAGTLVGGVGALYELVVRKKGDTAYRAAAALALGAALLLVWLNGAVGVIGSEDNDANLMYFGVLAVGITGAAIARFQPLGMARAMFATAFTIAFVAAVALIAGMGSPDSGPMVIVVLNAFFVALFVASAWLFRQAARA